jgi:hypothetical protein
VHLGVSSPIVEVFVKGGLPRDVRLLAARGQVTSDGCDRLALLALLTADEDTAVAATAAATVDALPVQALSEFLGQSDVPADLRAWFAARMVASLASAPDTATLQPPHADVPSTADDVLPDDDEETHQLLTSLPVPDKIKLATLGRREQRAILIRDPNRIVSTAVLSSPKLTDTEVENFARMQNVSDEVLRIIGTSRAWTKNYLVVAALVKNPRTPPAVSLPLVTRLSERDVKGLTVDRNLPETVRLAARKQLAVLQSRKS